MKRTTTNLITIDPDVEARVNTLVTCLAIYRRTAGNGLDEQPRGFYGAGLPYNAARRQPMFRDMTTNADRRDTCQAELNSLVAEHGLDGAEIEARIVAKMAELAPRKAVAV